MNRHRWMILLGVGLLGFTFLVYLLQIAIFREPRNTFFYLLQDLAFVPFQVLLVTLILNRLLAEREKRALLKKMNMVIGAFFSEVGTHLFKVLVTYDPEAGKMARELGGLKEWSGRDYAAAARRLRSRDYRLESRWGDLAELKTFLLSRRSFLLRLLENPNLLEHETFTELLWAVFHLTDELDHRTDFRELPPSDHEHLSGDMRRVYILLAVEWLAYLDHLRQDYPYLYSLAVRTNPFDPGASAVVKAPEEGGRRR